MCLLDTTDGALMMTLYASTSLARDQIAILYYSIVLTFVTIVAAMAVGIIQLLTLILNVAEPEGRFWDGVQAAGDNYDVIGGVICGSFIVVGLASAGLYGPFRRRLDVIIMGRGIEGEDLDDEAEEGEDDRTRVCGDNEGQHRDSKKLPDKMASARRLSVGPSS
jgi:high-affinity nickel-transport protein